MPVVGVTTDETQNLWIATNSALYLMKPGDKSFKRFDAKDGLHLPGNPISECNDSAGMLRPCPNGEADSPGISEIVGGGPDEVIVGYFGHHDWNLGSMPDGTPIDGSEQDPWRHSGKLERVRLKPNGTLEVIRFDMVSNNTVEFWHNRTVERMVYDHFTHPHELFVGSDHGVDKISPDKWKPNVGWFLAPENQQSWMSDHLHPRACFHAPCVDDSNQRLGDWRALAIDGAGDLWVGGRWAAGKIRYTADNTDWYNTPRRDKKNAIDPAFGDPYFGSCTGMRPIFCPPQEGDFVNISAVTVDKSGTIWWASGTLFNDPADVNYGVASMHGNGSDFKYYDPVRDIGLPEENVRDLLALPDGRLVVAGPNTGLVIWTPPAKGSTGPGTHVSIRAGQGIPDDGVMRLELDTMVDPPALHVATRGGAAVLRVLP